MDNVIYNIKRFVTKEGQLSALVGEFLHTLKCVLAFSTLCLFSVISYKEQQQQNAVH